MCTRLVALSCRKLGAFFPILAQCSAAIISYQKLLALACPLGFISLDFNSASYLPDSNGLEGPSAAFVKRHSKHPVSEHVVYGAIRLGH